MKEKNVIDATDGFTNSLEGNFSNYKDPTVYLDAYREWMDMNIDDEDEKKERIDEVLIEGDRARLLEFLQKTANEWFADKVLRFACDFDISRRLVAVHENGDKEEYRNLLEYAYHIAEDDCSHTLSLTREGDVIHVLDKRDDGTYSERYTLEYARQR